MKNRHYISDLPLADLKVVLKYAKDLCERVAEHYCQAVAINDTAEIKRLQENLEQGSQFKIEVENEINRKCECLFELVFDL